MKVMLTSIFTTQMSFMALHKEAFLSFKKGVSWLCKECVAKKNFWVLLSQTLSFLQT